MNTSIPHSMWSLRLRAAGAGLAALALAGCVLGPNYHRPPAPQADAYVPAKLPSSVELGAPIAADWYRLLGSQALDGLVQQALNRNPDLQAARARIGGAQAQLAQVAGARLPQLNGRLLANRAHLNSAPLTGAPGRKLIQPDLFAGLLELSYNLDLFGKLHRQLEASHADLAYARAQALNTYVTLVNQVVTTAFDYASADARLRASRALAAAEHKQLDLVQTQEQVGTVGAGDVLTARAQLQGTEATLPDLEQARDAARNALAALVGESPGSFKAPRLRLSDFHLPKTLPLSLPSQLVAQRPDILAAEDNLHLASAQIGVATASRLPSISLSANYGGIGSSPLGLFESGNALWSLAGDVTTPIFRGGSLKAQEDAAKAQYLEAAAQYRSTVLKAFSQVATALSALQHDHATLSRREAALDTARQALDLNHQQFQAGANGELPVLIAEQQLRTQVLGTIEARTRRFADVASLIRALGGGWWNAAGDPVAPLTAKDYDARRKSHSGSTTALATTRHAKSASHD
jgi:efflux transporter, outer membrane factor (OMF) lipoprotein, NodT family